MFVRHSPKKQQMDDLALQLDIATQLLGEDMAAWMDQPVVPQPPVVVPVHDASDSDSDGEDYDKNEDKDQLEDESSDATDGTTPSKVGPKDLPEYGANINEKKEIDMLELGTAGHGQEQIACMPQVIKYALKRFHKCGRSKKCDKLSKENNTTALSMERWLEGKGRPYWKLAHPSVRNKAKKQLVEAGSIYSLSYAHESSFCAMSDALEWLQTVAKGALANRIAACDSRPEHGRRQNDGDAKQSSKKTNKKTTHRNDDASWDDDEEYGSKKRSAAQLKRQKLKK